MRPHILSALALAALLAISPAQAQDAPVFRLTLKDHKFEPAELTVPAGQRIVITVRNADATPAEFESKELGAEKVISARRESTVRVGPLQPGRYPFNDEFHPEAAGAVIAVQQAAKE